ncbi:MAG TPA: hypothetical protein VFQ61_34285 [Polyangiaceae bacterium]|nr:hypothetical protein [Polyangiaceae bacterium]
MESDHLPASIRVGRFEPSVYVRFRPAWTYIEGIREFGRFFCGATFNEPEVAERARVIIQETLENAVKYSQRTAHSELELTISSDGKRLEISVCSAPSPEHYGALKRELQQLYARDPEQAYLAAFERAASDPEASARLGLARLRYECGADLSVSEVEGGRIRVTASAAL